MNMKAIVAAAAAKLRSVVVRIVGLLMRRSEPDKSATPSVKAGPPPIKPR